jgi:hypothetical protein
MPIILAMQEAERAGSSRASSGKTKKLVKPYLKEQAGHVLSKLDGR